MTQNEEIFRMLRKLNALSRRGPEPRPEPGPDDPERGPEGGAPCHRQHGWGRLLMLLSDNGPMSQAQLAARMDIRPQSLGEMVGKAEADGLVVRTQSEEDKRILIVSLTGEGVQRVADVREAHRRRAEEFLRPLSEDEKQAFAALLQKLIDGQHADGQPSDGDTERR